MAIVGTRISTNQFWYDKETRNFSQEASTLRNYNFLSRLYNDACDTGFVLVSHKTGREVPFYLEYTSKDIEGDIHCWKFLPAEPVPAHLRDVYVKIFND